MDALAEPVVGTRAAPGGRAAVPTTSARLVGSIDAVLAWTERALGTGRRELDRGALAALLTPLGWVTTFPEGDATSASVVRAVVDRMVLIRYEGSPFVTHHPRACVATAGTSRLALVELVHEGEGRFVRDDAVRRLTPGTVVLHPLEGRHRMEWTSVHCRRTYVLVDTPLLGGRAAATLRTEELVQPDAPLAAAAERLADVLCAPDLDPLVRLTAAQALHTLVKAMVARAVDREEQPDPELRERARRVLVERFADPDLDADAVARELRISRRHLFAQFAGGGDSFATTLRDLRLDHAADLLAGAGDSLAVRRVAHESGFAGPAQLARAFRERFGMTPTQFRAATLRGLPLPGGR